MLFCFGRLPKNGWSPTCQYESMVPRSLTLSLKSTKLTGVDPAILGGVGKNWDAQELTVNTRNA